MPSQTSQVVLVGESEAMARVRRLVTHYGPVEAPVLVSGETGTGKELVARELHRAGPRAGGPFVPVNCAAITGSLFDSEVFGSVRGAFTGAVSNRPGLVRAADGGVLFLDEIAELSANAQAKLLRFLEEGTYRPVGASREMRANARVIAATNRDLAKAVAAGSFRVDLYYRLFVLPIQLPPLRERLCDLPLLVDRFLSIAGPLAEGRRPTGAALAQLLGWRWPGNVRELRHTVERTLLRGGEGPIARFDLCPDSEGSVGNSVGCELGQLSELLSRHRGRLAPAAKELGVSVRTVQRRMKRFGLRGMSFRNTQGQRIP